MTPAERSAARIFLIGFMGSGKSTVGRRLARIMGLRFIDLDQRIEAAAGRSVARIFEHEGETGFRARERRELAGVARESGVVVAAGGGVMGSAENRELMAGAGTTVWLKPDFDTLLDRLAAQPAGQRPLFVDPAQARTLYESRLDDYGRAEFEIEIGADEGPGEVAQRIAVLLEGEACAT